MTFIRTQDWYSLDITIDLLVAVQGKTGDPRGKTCQEKPKRDKLQLRCADVLQHCLDVVRGESR